MPLAFRAVVRTLRTHYGAPPKPISRDPFRLIVWEQVAYLASDTQRGQAYALLRREVGLRPSDIMQSAPATLAAITRVGGSIAAPVRAQRLHQSAERVLRVWHGDLAAALALPVAQARKALTPFPMIGEPGADKILLFSRTARLFALDSNALRVLQRLGLITKHADYRTLYRNAQAALAPALNGTYVWLIAASQLLRLHGQTLCKAGAPRCEMCPLQRVCPSTRLRRLAGT